jgi:hypothetical protein
LEEYTAFIFRIEIAVFDFDEEVSPAVYGRHVFVSRLMKGC